MERYKFPHIPKPILTAFGGLSLLTTIHFAKPPESIAKEFPKTPSTQISYQTSTFSLYFPILVAGPPSIAKYSLSQTCDNLEASKEPLLTLRIITDGRDGAPSFMVGTNTYLLDRQPNFVADSRPTDGVIIENLLPIDFTLKTHPRLMDGFRMIGGPDESIKPNTDEEIEIINARWGSDIYPIPIGSIRIKTRIIRC